jgi:serine/threonine protein kinase/tetratricopeptide (TPR) repeat protein
MQAGEVIAERYQIVTTIGRGGMGEVSRCRDLASGKDVALKRIRPDIGPTARGELDQLFYKEAAALASVAHPNLVRARDFGFLDDGARFLVMEFVEGLSLEQVWERQALLPWDLLACVIDQLLLGLAHLHARGLVHRDLKPANVMLGDASSADTAGRRHCGPRVTILDLGLAAFREVAILDIMRPQEELHAQVARYATPPYCAPEQLLRHAMFLGPMTDLHAVGVLLHQFSSGELPFEGETDAELLEAVLRRAPIPLEAKNGAPKQVEPVIRKLLAKRPWQRYDFAISVRRALTPLWDVERAQEAWRELRRRHGVETTGPIAALSSLSKRVRPSALLALQVAELFGREREQASLIAAADQAGRGQRRVVALLGEAGVGKSRLGQWLVERLHERGLMHTLRISYGRAGGALSGVLGALERHFGFFGAPAPIIERALTTRWGRDDDARRLARALTRELRTGDQDHTPEPQSPNRSQLEQRVDLLLAVLSRISADRPLLLWLDDVQRAEDESLALVEAALGSEALPGVLVLITGRPEAAAGPLGELLTGHGVTPLTLQPLTRAPLEAMLRSLLVPDGSGEPPRELIDTLYRASRGNPLFAVQQLHAWRLRAQIWWEAETQQYCVEAEALAQVARNTTALWREQIDALTPAAKLAALAATTLGSSFERELLAQLLSSLELDADAVTLELVREQILIPEREHLWWYHDTLEEHLASELERAPRAAQILERSVTVLRAHPQAATRPYALLITRALRAAKRDHEAAATLLACLETRWEQRRVALHAREDLQLIEACVDERTQGRFLCMRSRAEWAACDYAAAEASALEGLRWAQQHGNERLRARTFQLLGEAHKARGRYSDAQDWLRQALESWVGLGEHREAALACLALAQGEHYMARYERAEAWLRRGLALAEAVSAGGLQTEGRWWLAWVLHDRGRYEEARAEVERALAAFMARESPLGIGQAHWLLATINGQQGGVEAAAEHLQQAVEHFELAGERWWLLASALMRAWLANVMSDFPTALAVAAEVRRQLEGLDTKNEIANALLASAAAQLGQDDTVAAEVTLGRVRGLDPPEPALQQMEQLLRAWLAVRCEAWPAAEEHLQRALTIWGELGLTAWAVPWQLAQLEGHGWPPALQRGLRRWRSCLQGPVAARRGDTGPTLPLERPPGANLPDEEADLSDGDGSSEPRPEDDGGG